MPFSLGWLLERCVRYNFKRLAAQHSSPLLPQLVRLPVHDGRWPDSPGRSLVPPFPLNAGLRLQQVIDLLLGISGYVNTVLFARLSLIGVLGEAIQRPICKPLIFLNFPKL